MTRKIWVQIHLWVGLTLGLAGVLIGITGSILVFDQSLDAKVNPQRYAVSGSRLALPYSAYLDNAAQAVKGRARPTNLRTPGDGGMPVVVFARAREAGAAYRVYLDPQTARVLDASPSGSGLIGWAHDLHGSLMLRDYSGREIVGAVGIAMLISSLSGLYLWWPRGRWKEALGMRRGVTRSRNLHYLFGLYGSVVLAMLSFTGILISYPEAGRAVVGLFGPVSPPARTVQAPEAPKAARPLSADEAVALVQPLYPAAKVAGIGLPGGPRGTYRISLTDPAGDTLAQTAVAFVDPGSGALVRRIDASTLTAADRFLALQRPLHEGVSLGLAGRIVICIAGLLPALLAVTGTMMWLRQRRQRRSTADGTLAAAVADR